LSTSARRSTSTLAASSGGCDHLSLTPSLSAHCSIAPPLAASVCVDDRSLSTRDSSSTSSLVFLSSYEIAQL
jgi:hypothetical protein